MALAKTLWGVLILTASACAVRTSVELSMYSEQILHDNESSKAAQAHVPNGTNEHHLVLHVTNGTKPLDHPDTKIETTDANPSPSSWLQEAFREKAIPSKLVTMDAGIPANIVVALVFLVISFAFCVCSFYDPEQAFAMQMSVPSVVISPPAASSSHDGRPDFFYVAYLETDSNDPVGTWNPSHIGASDGLQIAIVSDGKVERLATAGVCEHISSLARGQKEWYDVRTPAYCVNFRFEHLPTFSEATQHHGECGTTRLPVGVPGWGGNVLVVGEVYKRMFAAADTKKESPGFVKESEAVSI